MKRLALLLPLLALAAGCHNLSDGRATEDDPFLAQARAILAECRPGVEPPPPGSASRTTAIEFRCGDSSLWDGVPIEGRALEHVGIASFGKPADPADIALVRPYLAHTNAAVRNAAVRILEDWLADLAVPFPVDDPALPADLEAAAEARAAEPPPPLPAYDGGDASTFLRLVAVERRVQGPLPERPFAVLTNDIGRLDCWERLFLLDGDDSALRRVQEMLGVRYDGRDASRADPAAIRSRWLLAPAVDSGGGTPVRPCHAFPGGEWCRWHAAVGPRLDRLVPREWSGCVLPDPKNLRSPAATLAGGAAAPVRLDELPAYGGALDWEALSFLEDESVRHPRRRIAEESAPNGDGGLFPDLADFEFFVPDSVEFALRPDPATPDGVVLSAAQTFAFGDRDRGYVECSGPRFHPTNIVLRDEVPLQPGQTALFGVHGFRTIRHEMDRTPILSDIPLLGGLFTTETATTNVVETVLLVRYTPRHAEDAEGKSHAENAENAEPGPRAESAEGAELLPEQIGVGSRPHEGEDKHVVANEVDE